MTKEAKHCINALERNIQMGFPLVGDMVETAYARTIIKLIESLSAQLDQVTRERDAAVEDLKYVWKIDGTFCEICKHQPEEDCEKRKFENMDCFEWRGVEVRNDDRTKHRNDIG